MIVLFVFYAVICDVSSIELPCKSRDYGFGSTICVCDSNYCDTIANPTKSDFYIVTYTTSKSGSRFNKQYGIFNKLKSLVSTVKVNASSRYQKIIGWGGAFTDSAGINIRSLGDKAQGNLLKSYFSKNGIGYNLARVPVGGTDFSTRKYTYDDGEELDLELVNFKLAPEDYKYKIPLLQKAKSFNKNLKLLAAASYSPDWMKKNKNRNFLSESAYQSWARYFLKFLQEYNEENLRFWALSTGNEPFFGFMQVAPVDFVSWLPQIQSRWIAENLAPTLRNSNFSDVKILMLDDGTNHLPFIADVILNNTKTRNYVDGIAIHWYFNSELTPLQLKITQEHFPEKFILSTEACNILSGKPLPLGSWEHAEKYADDIINDLKSWVTGWVDWNLALDLRGGPNYINNFVDSPIIVNSTAGEFYKQPMFYILGHFSKFAPAGSYRIDVTGNTDVNVKVVAFERPDSSKAVVILNKGNSSSFVNIYDISRGVFRLNLEEKSITTIVYW